MNEDDVRKHVAAVLGGIAPEADIATVGDDEDLRAALDLDSMDFLNLVIGLARATGRSIPETDYPKLFTLAGLVGYLAV